MEVTIEITQFCESMCPYCSTNASPDGSHLPISEIERFLDNLIETPNVNIERINISGGEPLSHPDFYRVLKLCNSITDEVWVYTNALRRIIYNSDVIDEIHVHANVCVTPGRKIYIPEKAEQVHILKMIRQGRAKSWPEVNISVSRNFYDPEVCDSCDHLLLQANGKVVKAPCKKEYN